MQGVQIQITRQRTGGCRTRTPHQVHGRQAAEINGTQPALFTAGTISQPGQAYAVHACNHTVAIHAPHVHAVGTAAEIHAGTPPAGQVFPIFDTALIQLPAGQPGAAFRQLFRHLPLNFDHAETGNRPRHLGRLCLCHRRQQGCQSTAPDTGCSIRVHSSLYTSFSYKMTNSNYSHLY